MQGEDDDVESDAIAQLMPLLQRPEHLGRLQNFKADFQKQYEVAQAHLHSAVQTKYDDLRFAFENIHHCLGLMKSCTDNFREVDMLGTVCKNLLPEHDIIRRYSVARKNIRTTLQIIERFKNIEDSCKRLMKKLDRMQGEVRNPKDDQEIQNIYRELRNLVIFRNQLWREGKNYATEFKSLIQRKFEAVSQVASTLHVALDENIQDALYLAADDPTTLVYTVKIIEWEDRARTKVFPEWRIDAPYKAGCKDDGLMFAKALQKLHESIDDRLQISASGMQGESLEEKLGKLDELCEELNQVNVKVVPCFPPKYNISAFYQKRYENFLVDQVHEMVSDTSDMNQGETLQLARWIQEFEAKMMGGRSIPQELKDAVKTLAESYKLKSQDNLGKPIKNVFNTVKTDEPNEKANGKRHTFGPRDLFTLLYNHFSSIKKKYGSGEAMMEVAKLYGMLLNDYQRQMMQFLWTCEIVKVGEEEKLVFEGKEKTEEFLCAWLSSGIQYEENSERLQEMIRSKLKRTTRSPKKGLDMKEEEEEAEKMQARQHKGYEAQLQAIIKITKRGFRKVADEVVDILSTFVLSFVKEGEAFKALFRDMWLKGGNKMEEMNQVIFDEIAESLALYKEWTDWDEYTSKLTGKILLKFVKEYFKHFLNGRFRMTDNFLQCLRASKLYFVRRVGADEAFSALRDDSQDASFALFDAFERMFRAEAPIMLDKHFPILLKSFDPDEALMVVKQVMKFIPNVQAKDKDLCLERFRNFGEILNEQEVQFQEAERDTIGKEGSGFFIDIQFPKEKKILKPQHTKSASSQGTKFLKGWFSSTNMKSEEKDQKNKLPTAIIEENAEDIKAEEETEVIAMEDFLND